MPFTTPDGEGFPVPVLAQIDGKNFEICVPFLYRHTKHDEWIHIPRAESDRKTDLASVPGFLMWLVPRYGLHTLAAIVHDQLIEEPPLVNRRTSDRMFRDSLGELNVPWIRRWIMWTGVSLASTWSLSWLGKLRVALWGLGILVTVALFWQHAVASFTELEPWASWLVFGHGAVEDLGIVVALGLLFAPRFHLGWLAGVTAFFIFLPTVTVLAVTAVYLLLEKIARSWLSFFNRFVAGRFDIEHVDNVPAVMRAPSNVPVPAGTPRGCPELVNNGSK
jgi:Protein of unknown function (DUF1353)